jgi:predicted GNAT superfamily acetyltransferase
VVCNTYLRHLYGDMRDRLNAGLPSDRFQVEWRIAGRRVAERMGGQPPALSLAALQAVGAPVVNADAVHPRALHGDPLRPPQETLPLTGDRLLVQVPAHFQAVKSADFALARAWREHTRELFEAAFAQGYTVVDLLFEAGRSFYLLQRDWRPDED